MAYLCDAIGHTHSANHLTTLLATGETLRERWAFSFREGCYKVHKRQDKKRSMYLPAFGHPTLSQQASVFGEQMGSKLCLY